jgi:hypothetical protein
MSSRYLSEQFTVYCVLLVQNGTENQEISTCYPSLGKTVEVVFCVCSISFGDRLHDQVCHFLPEVDLRKCGNVRNTT